MGHEISLEVYKINVHRVRNHDNLTLDSFVTGINGDTDFLQVVNEFLINLNNGADIESALKRVYEPDTTDYYLNNRRLYGFIHCGQYGDNSRIKDIRTRDLKYQMTQDDATFKKYYFQLYVPEDSNFGVLVLQRIGKLGIYNLFNKIFYKHFRTYYPDYLVMLNYFLSNELIQKFIENGRVGEVVLRKNYLPPDLADQVRPYQLEKDDIKVELRFVAVNGKTLPFSKDKIAQFISDRNAKFFEFDAIDALGFNESYSSSIKVKCGSKERVISMNNVDTFRPYYDIDSEVLRDRNDVVILESIHQIANELIEDIIDNVLQL